MKTERKILELHYNWQPSISDGKEIFGEEYESAKVGEKNVVRIDQHEAQGGGDRWYYDIHMADLTIIRVFNPNKVVFAAALNEKEGEK